MEALNSCLLFKEILECLSSVAGARNVLGGNRWTRLGSRRRGIFFDSRAKFVKPAIVLLILAGNTIGYRLHTFKPRGRIEVRALLTGMKFESAFRAFAFRIKTLLQNSSAV
jgi:hypothetical protein